MRERMITGIFDNYKNANQLIDCLIDSRFDMKDITLVGADTDEFRSISASLVSKAPDHFMVAFMIVGAIAGGLSGMYLADHVYGIGYALAVAPMFACLSGAAAGGLMGTITGAVINFDQPEYDAVVDLGKLSLGKVLVSVAIRLSSERTMVESLMEDYGALRIENDVVPGPGNEVRILHPYATSGRL